MGATHLAIVNSSRVRLELFVEAAAHAAPEGARVLDAGAGDCRYAPFFARASYESADFCQIDKAYASVTYVCDLADIPVEDARYDMVLCTQVIEHVPNPRAVLGELARVLKPGGQLWLTAPFFYEPHELPHDYYRYTDRGLRWLLDHSGLVLIRSEWLEGYFATLGYQLDLAHRALAPRLDAPGIGWRARAVIAVFRLMLPRLSRFFQRLELVHKHITSGICKNHAIVAQKPATAPDAGTRS